MGVSADEPIDEEVADSLESGLQEAQVQGVAEGGRESDLPVLTSPFFLLRRARRPW